MLQPSRTKYRKQQKGRNTGKATRGNKVSFGEYGLKAIGRGRVTYIHPDCGFWMLKRNMADGTIRALVAGRDLYEGRTTK